MILEFITGSDFEESRKGAVENEERMRSSRRKAPLRMTDERHTP